MKTKKYLLNNVYPPYSHLNISPDGQDEDGAGGGGASLIDDGNGVGDKDADDDVDTGKDDDRAENKGDKKPEDDGADDKDDKSKDIQKLTDKDYDITKIELGIKGEDGEPFKFDNNDPLVQQVTALAVEHQAPPEFVNAMVKVHVEAQQETAKAIMTAQKEAQAAKKKSELAALEMSDEKGQKIAPEARIEKLVGSLKQVLGDSAYEKIAPHITTADMVTALETLVSKSIKNGFGTGNANTGEKQTLGDALYGGD